MGRLFLELLDDNYVFHCRFCKSLLATDSNFQSDSFQGSSGKAYLFKNVSNVICSKVELKKMTTGEHIVRDVFCKLCKSRLGWCYELAYPVEQRYKEGQFILEKNFIEKKHGVQNKATAKDQRSTSSSPSETIYNPMRYDNIQYANALAANRQHIYSAETFPDFTRLLHRAAALPFAEANQRLMARNNARLRRAHLPS